MAKNWEHEIMSLDAEKLKELLARRLGAFPKVALSDKKSFVADCLIKTLKELGIKGII